MNKHFTPPSPLRLSAVAIAAALTTFAGVAGAQTGAYPGTLTSSQGDVVRGGFADCVRIGDAKGSVACPPAAQTQAGASATRTAASAPASRAASSSAAGASAATQPVIQAAPGYVQSGVGNDVVRSGFGTCVRSGFWTPSMAAEPCDSVARASLPPAPVAAAQPEPAPAPQAQPQPAPEPTPAPLAAPEPPRPVIQKFSLSADVLFEFDKAQLRDTGRQRLDEVAEGAKDARVEEVVATGYADPIGNEQYNEKLSAERAAAVREYLVQKGVEPDRIVSEGRGETQEFTKGQCEKLKGRKLIQCFEPNRRVDVEFLGSREVAATGSPSGAGATR
jgi:OOP family OmpA-OmpF porin